MITKKVKLEKSKYSVTDGNKCSYIVKKLPYTSRCGGYSWAIYLDGEWVGWCTTSMKDCMDQIEAWYNHSNEGEGI